MQTVKSKQQKKWEQEIKQLEASIPQMEADLKSHQEKLLKDMAIDFYEIQRRQTAGKRLIDNIKKAKKRITDLKEKI